MDSLVYEKNTGTFYRKKSLKFPCHHYRTRFTWCNFENFLEKAVTALVPEIHRLPLKLASNVNEQNKGGERLQPTHWWFYVGVVCTMWQQHEPQQ